MNFLAHLFLAGDSPESRLGNLAGDFVKGALGDRFAPAIRDGIRMHRRIDAFTDSHVEVSAMRKLLFEEQRHYARVIVDLFLDHFLASTFSEWSETALDDFVAQVHEHLDGRIPHMPAGLQRVYPRMRDEGWLVSYRSIDGIRDALVGMSYRIGRRADLAAAADHLVADRVILERHFRAFFPEVVAYARVLRSTT